MPYGGRNRKSSGKDVLMLTRRQVVAWTARCITAQGDNQSAVKGGFSWHVEPVWLVN
jgi:hypothetical protein